MATRKFIIFWNLLFWIILDSLLFLATPQQLVTLIEKVTALRESLPHVCQLTENVGARPSSFIFEDTDFQFAVILDGLLAHVDKTKMSAAEVAAYKYFVENQVVTEGMKRLHKARGCTFPIKF